MTMAIDALLILLTLLIMPSASRNGRTISIACFASDVPVSETSHSLVVSEATARHNLSPEFRTVSFMSSIARNAAIHISFKFFPTYITGIHLNHMSDMKLLIWSHCKDTSEKLIWERDHVSVMQVINKRNQANIKYQFGYYGVIAKDIEI